MRNHPPKKPSHATRKPAIKTQSHSRGALFIASLTIAIALVVLGPMTGAGQPSGKSAMAGDRFQAGETAIGATQPSSPLFLPAVTYAMGHSLGASSVAVADLNRDGKLDLVVAAGGSTVAVMLGNGDGTFQPAVALDSGGLDARSAAVADVNEDGKLDLVVANLCVKSDCSKDGVVGVLLGNGDGTFQPVVAYDSGGTDAVSVAIADLNGDGHPDVVVANCGPIGANTGCPTGQNGRLGVMLGNGDGSFRPVVTYDSGGSDAVSVAVADVNRDGKLDLVVVDECAGNCAGVAGILLGNGDGTFRNAVTYASGGFEGASVAIVDANGDGKPDLVVANACGSHGSCNFNYDGTAGILLGNGDGTFQAPLSYDSGGIGTDSVVVADVNGDGKPDLIVTNSCVDVKCAAGSVGVLLGNGNGTFQAAVTYNTSGPYALSAAVADVNADTLPDLLVANAGRCGGHSSGCVSVLLHKAAGSKPTTTTLVSSLNPSMVGQGVTFTALVSSTAGTPPNGETIIFTNGSPFGSAFLGRATLSGGSGSFTTSSLPAGTSAITASYDGDANYAASASPGLGQIVNKYATSTSLTSSPNPSTHGQAVTFIATVTSTGPKTPTGKISFKDGTIGIGSAILSRGVATLVDSTLGVGAHSITAAYGGDGTSATSTSPVLNQVVN